MLLQFVTKVIIIYFQFYSNYGHTVSKNHIGTECYLVIIKF